MCICLWIRCSCFSFCYPRWIIAIKNFAKYFSTWITFINAAEYDALEEDDLIQQELGKNKEEPPFFDINRMVVLYFKIRTYTNEGDLVVDCCAGSGTAAVAAINAK